MHQTLINTTVEFVKATLANAEGGHDWWHIYRVWQAAKQIAKGEKADNLVVELSALLHDIADSKFNGGDEAIGPAKAKAFLESQLVMQLSRKANGEVDFIYLKLSCLYYPTT